MRGFRPTGELALEEPEEGYRPRPTRPAPGKVTRTMRMDGRVIARRSTGDGDAAFDTDSVAGLVERTAGGGDALPDALRGSFERSLGVGLDGVRVHTDSEAAGVAKSIAAKAFTVGQDIYFGAGQYDPASKAGQHLIAHEVAHTAQQSAGGASHVHTKLEVSAPGDAIETEADAAADAMLAGEKATVSAAPVTASRTGEPGATPAGPAGASDPNAGAGERADKPNEVTINITPVPGAMVFNAETYLDLYKQINERALADKCCGRCICKASIDTTNIDKYKIVVTVSLQKEIPSWTQIAKQPKDHQDKFNKWAASVKTHEDTHYAKYEAAYKGLKAKLINVATQADAEAAFDKVGETVEAEQQTFDDDKSKQPAPLDIPGGVEKVPSSGVARKATGDGTVDTSGVAGLVERTSGRGDALPDSLRGSFEESLGVRLADVRVHTDGESAAAARAIAAKAFTVGQDIYFGAGQFDPASKAGQHLIAHEVAHTAQQRSGGASHVHTKLEVSAPGDAIESEADAAADAMIAGQKASVSAAPIAASRTPEGAAPAGPAGASDPNAGASETAAGPVKVSVKITPNPGSMVFNAPNYLELYKQVSARAQADKCAGRCICKDCGMTTDWDARTINVTVTLEKEIPSWTQIASQPKEHQEKFNKWAASVKAHEDTHYKKYEDAFNSLKTKLASCKDQAAADKVWTEVTEKVEQDQQDFDNDKSKQPAPLDIPGGVEKIDSTPGAKKSAADEGAAEPAAAAEPVARKAAGDGAVDTSGVSGLVHRTRGGGDALPDALRGSFEQSLGVGLGGVRVHTDGESAGVAKAISARAFTVGQDIYFGDGQYDPASESGKHLLAHEVAHTAQQAAGGTHVHTKMEVSQAGDALETEADAAADAMVAGHKASVSAAPIGGIHRKEDEEKAKAAEEIEKFKQGPAVTKTIKPEGGLGLFESTFTPAALSLVAVLKVKMIFESGKREEYEDAGFPPEAFIWTPAEAEQWKSDFVAKVKAGWSGKHPIKAGKKYWEKVAVTVTVNVDVQHTEVKKPVKDIDPDHAIDPPQDGTHWTIVVGKYPPRSVRMKTSSVSPRGTHHGKDDNGRNGVFPNKGGEPGGTVRMDSNDLRPEEKDTESAAERTALEAVFFHPHTEVPMNEMAVHSAARSLLTKGKDNKGGAGDENSHLVVTGHASPDDAVTTADDAPEVRKQRNMEISNKRASLVSGKLQELGVPADKLVVRTVGEEGTLGLSLGPDSANPKDCRVDLELSKTPTQVGALHEVGHMLGSPDEYHEPGAPTANVMAKGNKIQTENYAPFAQALNEMAPGIGWSA